MSHFSRAATLTRNVELLLNDRAAVRLSDANDVDFECPLELDDPQNHLLREASDAEWNELEHVTIRLSQGARDYVAGYMARKVSIDSECGSVFFGMENFSEISYGYSNFHGLARYFVCLCI